MTKPQILQLVLDISNNKADPLTVDTYFDQIIDDLGRHCDELTVIESDTTTANNGIYSMPDDCVVEQAVIYDDRQLQKTEIAQLEAWNSSWRVVRGKPYAYTKDEQTARSIRLFPIPKESSEASSMSYGEPEGVDFPINSLTWIFTSRDTKDIPPHLVLGIVFQILAWEFVRPCKHQSAQYSALCQKLSSVFFSITGISWQQVGAKAQGQ